MSSWDDTEEAELFFDSWDLYGDCETDAVPDLAVLLGRARMAGAHQSSDDEARKHREEMVRDVKRLMDRGPAPWWVSLLRWIPWVRRRWF